MKVVRTKLGEHGRIIIPAAFRQNLHLVPGDDLILHMQDSTICITTADQALQKLQSKVQNYINTTGQPVSLVDELINTRRSEGKHD